MRIRAAVICVLVAALAACGGNDEPPASEDATLAKSSFKELVASGLEQADLSGEPGYGLKVRAQQGPDWVDLALGDAFAEYRKDPDSRGEIVAGLVDEARRRLDEGISQTSFGDIRRGVMPLLEPRFALRDFGFRPAQTPYVARLAVIYGVQGDDSFTVVRPRDVDRWGVTLPELHEVALDNLLRQTNREQKLLCEPANGTKLCGWASGDGYDATRMIVPELRRQIEREYDGDRAMYAVPTENVFVALPFDLATRSNTETLLRTKVQHDFTAGKKPVSPELFVERDGEIVACQVPLPAIHVGSWPAITRRQSTPSPLPRLHSALAADECALRLGAHDPEAGQHHWKGH